MAETKYPGGAYLSADGKTWHDANGKVIPAPAGSGAQADQAPVITQSVNEAETSETVTPTPAVTARRGGNKAKDETPPAAPTPAPEASTEEPKG